MIQLKWTHDYGIEIALYPDNSGGYYHVHVVQPGRSDFGLWSWLLIDHRWRTIESGKSGFEFLAKDNVIAALERKLSK